MMKVDPEFYNDTSIPTPLRLMIKILETKLARRINNE